MACDNNNEDEELLTFWNDSYKKLMEKRRNGKTKDFLPLPLLFLSASGLGTYPFFPGKGGDVRMRDQ
jgi:hypothetical protein